MAGLREQKTVAVLTSGGADSAVLCVKLLESFQCVFPLYVRFGLRWEGAELEHLRSFLESSRRQGLMPLAVLEEPMASVYGTHWSTTGGYVPNGDSADEAVYLPGRNLMLISKASVWCALRSIGSLALGTLAANPFEDASLEFDATMQQAVSLALGQSISLLRPYRSLDKSEVLRAGADLPLELTFSCIDPQDGAHCGSCNKCAERSRAFRAAGIVDKTLYRSTLCVLGPRDGQVAPHP